MPSSIPQVGGQHWRKHHRAQHFLAACATERPFAEQALVSHCELMYSQQGRAG